MAIFFDAPVEPDDLTYFVREVPVTAGRVFSSMFPTEFVDDNKVDWGEITHTNRTAKYRAFDGRLHVSSRDTGLDKSVPLPPLSTSFNMGEYERLQIQFARTGGTRQQALVKAIYNDAENGTNEVLNRAEMAWGDVLTDFKFTLAGEGGLYLETDFGAPSGHLVTAALTWANPAALALSELISWHDVYTATNGHPAGEMRMGIARLRNLTRNTEVINAIAGAAATRSMVSLADLQNLLSTLGLPPIGPTIDTSLDVDGVTTAVLPADKLLFLPPNIADLGYFAYGVTATALELVNANSSDMSFEEAPGIVGVVCKDGPPFRQWTFIDAVGMPILRNPKKLLVADLVP